RGEDGAKVADEPDAMLVHVDDDDLDVVRAGGSEGEGLVEIGLRDDACAGADKSRLDDGLRMLLAREDDLDPAAVRLDPHGLLADELHLDRAADRLRAGASDPRQRVGAGP